MHPNDTPENSIDPTSLDSLMGTIRTVFPDAELGDDKDGQILIYTGLYQVGDSSVPLAPLESVKERSKDG